MTEQPDRDLVAWLADGPARAPEGARARAFAAIRTVSQRPAWIVALSGGELVGGPAAPLRRPAWIAAALVLLATMAIGFAIAGSRDRDPLRSEDPPVIAEASIPPGPPSAAPSRDTDEPTASDQWWQATPDLTFTSSTHGFTIQVSSEWTIEPATDLWSGSGPWDRTPAADVFTPTPGPECEPSDATSGYQQLVMRWQCAGRRLSVTSTPIDAGTTVDAWLATHVPARGVYFEGRCQWDGLAQPAVDSGWQDGRIGGLEARVRNQCGYSDAVLVVDDRAFVFSTFHSVDPGGYQVVLEHLTRTFGFIPVAPAPWWLGDPNVTRTSELYGYSIQVPSTWVFTPATEPWDGSGRWDVSPAADVMGPASGPECVGLESRTDITTLEATRLAWRCANQRLAINAIDMPDDLGIDDWITRSVPDRDQYVAPDDPGGSGHHHCVFQGPRSTLTKETSDPAWVVTEIAGIDARVRSECGFLDAVVVVGRRAYVISMFQDIDFADSRVLDRLAGSLSFSRRFTSDLYGYSIDIPASWGANPATTRWSIASPPDSRHEAPTADVVDMSTYFERPARFSVVATPVPAEFDLETWTLANVGLPSELSPETYGRWSCRSGDSVFLNPGKPAWGAWTIGDQNGMFREACGDIDATVVVNGRLYVIRFWTGLKDEWNAALTVGVFRNLEDSMTFAD